MARGALAWAWAGCLFSPARSGSHDSASVSRYCLFSLCRFLSGPQVSALGSCLFPSRSLAPAEPHWSCPYPAWGAAIPVQLQ